MGRPKKNVDEQPLNMEGDKLFNEQQKAAESDKNATQKENNEQLQEGIEEDVMPISLESWAEATLDNDGAYIISYQQDIELYEGRLMLKTGICINNGWVGFISPIEDNAYNGLKAEGGIRLTNSDVICMKASKNAKIVLNIGDNIFIQEQTNFGTRPRRLKIPAHTPVAKIVLFKQ